jgi:hypothetical protein
VGALLAVSQEGLSSMELVIFNTRYYDRITSTQSGKWPSSLRHELSSSAQTL